MTTFVYDGQSYALDPLDPVTPQLLGRIVELVTRKRSPRWINAYRTRNGSLDLFVVPSAPAAILWNYQGRGEIPTLETAMQLAEQPKPALPEWPALARLIRELEALA